MPYTNYLRWILLIGLAAIPFISFIVATGENFVPAMFFPFITGKNFAFRILVEILAVAYIILAIKEPKYRPRASLIMWVMLGFVAWMGLATLASIDPVKSFWSNFERMDGYVTIIHIFLLFLIAGAVFTAEKWWDTFFRVSVVAGALQGLYGLMQLLGVFEISSQSGPRIDTTFGNAIYVAVFMLFNIFITIYLLTRDRRAVWLQVFYGVALVLQFIALFYSQTRGALLGVIGGLVVVALYIAWRGKGEEWRVLRKWSIGFLVGIVVLGGLFWALRDSSFVRNSPTLNRIASISLTEKTTMSRFILWREMAIPGAMERPLLGWGQENFNFVFNKYYEPAMYDQEQWFDRAHNEFIDWLVAGGIPAFLLYILLFVLSVIAIIRSDLSIPGQAAFLGLLAAYGFSNITVFHDLMSFIYFILIISFAHAISGNALPRWVFLSKPVDDRMVAIAAPIVVVVFLVGGWILNSAGVARAQSLLAALQGNNPSTGAAYTPEERIAAFRKTLDQGELGYQEVMEQLFQFASNSIAPGTAVNPQVKQDAYNLTRSEGEKLLSKRPGDARLELFMGLFEAQFGQFDKSLTHLTRAKDLSPNKQQILFQLGTVHLQRGNVTAALPLFKSAFDLAPSYETARVMYAGALMYAGQGTQADAVLTEGFGTVLHDNDQLLQIYTNTRQFDRVIGIWKSRAEKNPNNADIHLGLAQAYFTAGDVPNTIATLQKVSQLNPAMAAQIQQIISQIQSGALKPGQ
ncbi:MAG TPA: O-antigen ligase family protein [Candidatus Paceibacterota bacterium]|nr:O-antigen ligase family protein [Candidatus Paceibacterota bacterium]